MINYPTQNSKLEYQTPELYTQQRVKIYLGGLEEALNSISPVEVAQIIDLIIDAGRHGKMIFICGNGGSASTASHMACDLAKGTRIEGFRPFRAIALTDSLPQITAWANDNGYDTCFSGQLEGLGQPGDLLIAISGSGNSPNVLSAVETAQQLGMTTIGLAGFKGGALKSKVDYCLVIPAACIEQVEDAHLVLEHTICATIRLNLAEKKRELMEAAS
ncbi:SIS domain-containing protein [Candidatus Chlorohelix sp.]|uniref:D-sedoheptulose-7-phosphate isomerase n=1 Tax=Candidatus Chlorohelix sp. TaxID=3139201 RepID=UPI00304D53F2